MFMSAVPGRSTKTAPVERASAEHRTWTFIIRGHHCGLSEKVTQQDLHGADHSQHPERPYASARCTLELLDEILQSWRQKSSSWYRGRSIPRSLEE